MKRIISETPKSLYNEITFTTKADGKTINVEVKANKTLIERLKETFKPLKK